MFNKSYLKIFLLWYKMEKYEEQYTETWQYFTEHVWWMLVYKSTDTPSEYVECNPFPIQEQRYM